LLCVISVKVGRLLYPRKQFIFPTLTDLDYSVLDSNFMNHPLLSFLCLLLPPPHLLTGPPRSHCGTDDEGQSLTLCRIDLNLTALIQFVWIRRE